MPRRRRAKWGLPHFASGIRWLRRVNRASILRPDNGLAPPFVHSRLSMDPFASAQMARRTREWLPVSSHLFPVFSSGG